MKKIAYSKNSRIFATSFAKRYFKPMIGLAVFYANASTVSSVNVIGYQISVVCYSVIGSKCLLAKKKRGDSLYYIHSVTNNFITQMPKDNEITHSVKYSNGIGTPKNGAKSVSFIPKKQINNPFGIIKNLTIINGIKPKDLKNSSTGFFSTMVLINRIRNLNN